MRISGPGGAGVVATLLAACVVLPLVAQTEKMPGYEDYKDGYEGYLGDGILKPGEDRIIRLGRQPVNMSLASFYNVVKPDSIGPDWSVRVNFQLMFPRGRVGGTHLMTGACSGFRCDTAPKPSGCCTFDRLSIRI